ncbi:MAG: hypothetical protein HUJ86_06475 [Synergistes sp.]|nr:hypothetical protein [Synergistes sp.]
MKKTLLTALSVLVTLLCSERVLAANAGASENNFYITANGRTFTAVFANNTSAAALKKLLADGDLTIKMNDYGGFEKVGELGRTIPRSDEDITTEPGDIILYLGSRIVIYYDSNTWNFTRIGKINNVSKKELLNVLGKEDVEVKFSLTKPE